MHEQAQVRIVDERGKAIEPARPSKASMLAGGQGTPYDAASWTDEHMADWQPNLWSPDTEINFSRDRIVSRVRDLARNDGWASAAITRTLDNVVGGNFRPIPKPDYYALQHATGIRAFDHKWADEFGRAIEAHWRTWAADSQNWCDVERGQTIAQMMKLAFRHKLVDGDALAIVAWRPDRVRPGAARFATCVQIIDPDRLSNPGYMFDTKNTRGGVELDDDGAAIGYHIRRAHQGDWFNAGDSMVWELIPRETRWGRPIIIHDYERDRAAQHRGIGILTPVLQRLKMLIKYDGTELDAAIVNAIFGAYVESPFDQSLVEDAMDEGGDGSGLSAYQEFRLDYHNQSRIRLGGVRMPVLAPGESINTVASPRPHSNFAAFESAVLRNVAAGCGLNAQHISQNWSEVNYSSYRAAMLEAWKTFTRRRDDFAVGFAQPLYTAWLEEAFDTCDLPLPAGAPEFLEVRSMYARCKWMGPGRGYVDDVKEKQGAILGMDAGLSTLEDEAATLSGRDWREVLDQRKVEIEWFRERGLPLPKWSGEAEADLPTADEQIQPSESA